MDSSSGATGRAKRGRSPSGATTGETDRQEKDDVRRDAKDTAREAKHEAKEATREAKHEAKQAARSAKEEVKKAGREVKEEAERRTDRWTSKAGQQVNAIARALDAAADRLHEDDQAQLAGWVSEASEEMERMAGYLGDEDPRSMLRDLEGLARRNPGAFLGTTFAAGLAMGRFLRASEPTDSSGSSRADDGRARARRAARGPRTPIRYDAREPGSVSGGATTGGLAGARSGSGGPKAGSTDPGRGASDEPESGSGGGA